MSNINLLPWREELRIRRNRWFFIILGITIIFSVSVTMTWNALLGHRIAVAHANIAYIENELQAIESEMVEVKMLQENKKQILSRMTLIQSLEQDRASIVKFLDHIPRIVPGTLHLTTLSRKEELEADGIAKRYAVFLQGIALTNGGISTLLKNLELLKWISGLKLNEVFVNKNGVGLQFKISFLQNLTE